MKKWLLLKSSFTALEIVRDDCPLAPDNEFKRRIAPPPMVRLPTPMMPGMVTNPEPVMEREVSFSLPPLDPTLSAFPLICKCAPPPMRPMAGESCSMFSASCHE